MSDLAGRSTALSPAEILRLDLWADAVFWSFNVHAYLVGSVLTRRDFRDVDVRVPLSDGDPMFEDEDRLRFIHVATSSWAQQMTGLPVDFQFQTLTDWDAQNGPVNPIGGRWRATHNGHAETPEDSDQNGRSNDV